MAQKRTKNYTEVEKEELLRLVESYSHVLENKRMDGVTVGEKKKTWDLISNTFNASASTGKRSGDQLKMLYNNMKRVAKKGVADEHKAAYLEAKELLAKDKREQKKTGGGSYTPQLTERGARILASVPTVRPPMFNLFDNYFDPGASGSGIGAEQNFDSNQSEEQEIFAPDEQAVPVRTTSQWIVGDLQSEEQEMEAVIPVPVLTARRSRNRRYVTTQQPKRSKLSNKQLKRKILINKLKESQLAITCRQKQLRLLNVELRDIDI